MKIHASGEDYLEAILVLQKKMGMVRSIDLARHMGFSKPSISHAVGVLRDGGFLTMDEDGFLHLTDIGREVAEKIYERHQFFTEQLVAAGVDRETAEQDACRIEHAIFCLILTKPLPTRIMYYCSKCSLCKSAILHSRDLFVPTGKISCCFSTRELL